MGELDGEGWEVCVAMGFRVSDIEAVRKNRSGRVGTTW